MPKDMDATRTVFEAWEEGEMLRPRRFMGRPPGTGRRVQGGGRLRGPVAPR